MPLFQKPFFQSKDKTIEDEYAKGVSCLMLGDKVSACKHLTVAMNGGHVSATYNLYLVWGSGSTTPYDIDAAADCLYRAAALNHTLAKDALPYLEAADRGRFGIENIQKFVNQQGSEHGLVAMVMICVARFLDVLCRQYGATKEVIAHEIDGAAASDRSDVLTFVRRTGIEKSFYAGGVDRFLLNSPAHQITYGLNLFSAALHQAGFSGDLATFARCSVVGYIVQKSKFGKFAKPLLGLDQFFGAEEATIETEVNSLLALLMSTLSTPKHVEWFARVANGWETRLPVDVGSDVNEALKIARVVEQATGFSLGDIADAIAEGEVGTINRRLNKPR